MYTYRLSTWQSGKKFACQCRRVGDKVSIPGSERFSEVGNATDSSILAWEIPWTEEPAWLQSMGLQKNQT